MGKGHCQGGDTPTQLKKGQGKDRVFTANSVRDPSQVEKQREHREVVRKNL